MAEAIKLSSGYYVDPKFADISANAERLFMRLLAWCGAHETAGLAPRQVLAMVGLSRSYGALNELITRGLVADNGDLGYSLPGWSKWQSNVDELAQRRRSDRERKAVSRGKSRDIPEMSQALGKGREGKGDRNVGSAAASSERERAPHEPSTHFADGTPIPGVADADVVPFRRDRGPAPSPGANTLAATFCPTGTPGTQIRALAAVVQELIDDPHVQRADLEAGLAAWRDRPGAGPRLLPGLVTDAAKIRATPAGSPGTSAVADKVAGWLAVGQQFASDPNSQKELDQ